MAKAGEIADQLERIRTHFSGQLYHQLLRRAYTRLDVPRPDWQRIMGIVDGNIHYLVEAERISFPDVYETIISFGTFVRSCRTQVCGSLRDLLGSPAGMTPQERMLRDITIGTFSNNLSLLNELLNRLLDLAIETDQELHPGSTVAARYPDLGTTRDSISRGCPE